VFTILLNRVLEWVDFVIHYISGYLLSYLVGGHKPQWYTRPKKASNSREACSLSVVVTGSSEGPQASLIRVNTIAYYMAGIGLATSLFLASKGYTVFATVKDEDELSKIKGEIKERDVHPQLGSIIPIVMNVLSNESITSAAHKVSSEIGRTNKNSLVGVINNAGYCMISPIELTPDKAARDLFELDFFAYIAVIRAFLSMIKKNKGRFINVGIYGGYVNPLVWVSYSAAKAAIEGLSGSWRFELELFGVGITIVRPGWTRCAPESSLPLIDVLTSN
jgi:NAD(P)-dependent dehydrogenase (short-subunit alcohol dehydrogenase family)